MSESILRRVGAGVLSAALVSTLMLPAAAFAQPQQDDPQSGGAAQSSALQAAAAAEKDTGGAASPGADGATQDDDAPVTIVVELEQSQPGVFDFLNLFAQNDRSHESYRAQIREMADSQAGQMPGTLVAQSDESTSDSDRDFYNVIDGFTVQAPKSLLDDIKAMDGVANAFVSEAHPAPLDAGETDGPKNASSLGMTGADAVAQTGKGQAIAIVDTGLKTDHEGFAGDLDDEALKLTESQVGDIKSQLNAGKDGVYISEKIPFAYDYAMGDADVSDGAGHGTHVAGIAGANAGDVRGTAPDAQLVIMKVSSDSGVIYDDALIAALDDCAKFDLAAVNVSIGADGGFSGDAQDTFANAVNALESSGTVVNVAAGNSYSSAQSNLSGKNLPYATDPDSGTISSPASAAQATAVASANNVEGLPYFTTSEGDAIEWQGAQKQSDSSPWPTLDALPDGEYELFFDDETDAYGDGNYYHRYGSAMVTYPTDKIVLVERGGTTPRGSNCSFGDKIRYTNDVLGLIVFDNEEADKPMKMLLDEWADYVSRQQPAVSVTKASGEKLKALAKAGGKITIKAGQITEPSSNYVVNDFSSWGVTPEMSLKPDITAPGGNINSTTYDGGYGYMSGTSMATPQMTGISAQMRQYVDADAKFAGMTDEQRNDAVTQLLMSTAKPMVDVDVAGSYLSPRHQGSGVANVPAAMKSNVYLTVEGAKDAAHPKAELGESADGAWSFTVTLHNLGDEDAVFTPSTAALSEQIADGLFQQHSTNFADAGIAVGYSGPAYVDGKVSVAAHGESSYTVTLTCEDAFKTAVAEAVNGTFVDGFAMLAAEGDGVDLSVPFLGFYGDWSKAPIFDGKLGTADAHLWGSYLSAGGIGGQGGPLGFNPLDTDSAYAYHNKTYKNRDDVLKNYHPDRLVVSDSADNYAPHAVTTNTFLLRGASEFQWGFTKKDADEGIQAYYRAYLKKSQPNPTVDGDPIRSAETVANGYAQFNFKGLEEGDYQVVEQAVVAGKDGAQPQEQVFDVYYDKTAPKVSDVVNTEGDDATVTFTVTDASWLAGVTVQENPVYVVSTNEAIATYLASDLDVEESVNADGDRVYDVTIPVSKLKESWLAGGYRDEADMPNTLSLIAWDWGMNPSKAVKAVLKPVPATGITLSERALGVAPGQNKVLEAELEPDDTTDDAIDWTSSDESVATVDETGKVTGVSVGTATVTATVHGRDVKATAEVTVKELGNKTGILLSDNLLRVQNNGGEGKVSAILSPALSGKAVNWATSDENVVSFEVSDDDPNAVELYGGYQVGVATISATVVDGGNVYSAEVEVRNWPDDYEDFEIDGSGTLVAYNGASLVVELPNDVKSVGESVFADKRATEIRIPASVESIGKEAFLNTTASQIVFEDTEEHPSHLTDIGERAFANDSAGQISWSSIRFPESVTTLGKGVMQNKSCAQIYVPASVTVIPDNAFTGTHEAVYIGDDVTWIGDNAFSAGGPQAMMFGALFIIGHEDEQMAAGDSLLPSKLQHIGAGAFANTEVFLNVAMPEGVTYIGAGAFSGASQSIHNNGGPMLQVTFNEGLQHIGDGAFSGTRIKEISIPDSVTELGDGAFGSIGTLEKVKIGKNVEAKRLGRVFAYSDSITTFELADGCANYSLDDQGIVYNKDKTVLVAFPMGKADPEYVIPEGVTTIGACAFDAYDNEFLDFCKNYPKSISFPDSLQVIEEYALNTAFDMLALGSNVKQIAENAFGDQYGHDELGSIAAKHLVVTGGDDASISGSASIGYNDTAFFGEGVTSLDYSNQRVPNLMVLPSTLKEFKMKKINNGEEDISWSSDPFAIYVPKDSPAWEVVRAELESGKIDFDYWFDGWSSDGESVNPGKTPIMHDYQLLEAGLATEDELVPGATVSVEAQVAGGVGERKVRWYTLNEQGEKTYVASEPAASGLDGQSDDGADVPLGFVAAGSAPLAAASDDDPAEVAPAGEWSDQTTFNWTVPSDGSQLYVEVTDDSHYTTSGTFAETPAWEQQPAAIVAHQGDEVALSAKAAVADGALTYQWFKATAEDFSDAVAATRPASAGEDGVATLDIDTDELGVAYYRVKAVNTVAKWEQTASSTSDLVKVEILPVDAGALESAIASAEAALESPALSAEDKAALEQAIAQAKQALAEGGAKQADIDALAEKLTRATEQTQAAEQLVASKVELGNQVAEAEKAASGASTAKADKQAKKALAAAIEAARAVAADPDASAEEVAAAKSALAKALSSAKASAAKAASDSSAGKDDGASGGSTPAASGRAAVKAGSTVSAGAGASKAAYKVAKVAKGKKAGTVWYVKPASKKIKKASVPATVKISGKSYKVIGVKAKAFKGCKKLAKVVIGKNVTKVGAKAFAGCKKLSKVTIGAKVKSIGKNAFAGCKSLKTVTVKSGKLTRASVKNIAKAPKVKTIKLSGKAAKAKKAVYKKAAGKKVRVK